MVLLSSGANGGADFGELVLVGEVLSFKDYDDEETDGLGGELGRRLRHEEGRRREVVWG